LGFVGNHLLCLFWLPNGIEITIRDVFLENTRDLGSPVHSREFFSAILNEFPDTARLMILLKGKETMGGGLCLLFKNTLLMPWASSLRSYFSSCPNNLLYWETIRWTCENGYKQFDFGRSSVGSGTYRFQKQWGAREVPFHWQCLSKKANNISVIDSDDAKFQWASWIWKRIPMAATRWIGLYSGAR
jgi:serine/alanine adding enzyme